LDELQKIIIKHHTGFSETSKKHFGHTITLNNIRQNGLYWAKMTSDVHDFIASCPDCIETRREIPIKERKVIIAKKPLERIQGDLISLTDEQIKACGNRFKFILSCVDHFSKYKWIYPLEDKAAFTILQCLEGVFASFGNPTIFQTDNGKEFKNKLISAYMNKNKIKFIQGSVRHPQSQGLVERHNRELKDYLEKAFRNFQMNNDKNTEWKLHLEIENFKARENNRYHTVTKYKPNEIIISKDKYFLEKVKNNIENSVQAEAQKYNETIIEKLKKNLKVFIVRNVVPNNNHTRLQLSNENKFVKKKVIKIPAIIAKDYRYEDNAVKIQIMATTQTNLKIKNNYSIDSNYLSIPDENAWEITLQQQGRN